MSLSGFFYLISREQMGCGKSKYKSYSEESAPAPVSSSGGVVDDDDDTDVVSTPTGTETATVTTDSAGILSLELTGESIITIDPDEVDMGHKSLSSGEFLYINLGIIDIDGSVLNSRPVLDIYYSENSNPTSYILLYPNLIIDTFDKNVNSSWICKVRLSSSIITELKNIKIDIRWERPSGGSTTSPIEVLSDVEKVDIKSTTDTSVFTDNGSMQVVTEPFTNYRKKYLAIEGFMNDHPLLGKTYAKF